MQWSLISVMNSQWEVRFEKCGELHASIEIMKLRDRLAQQRFKWGQTVHIPLHVSCLSHLRKDITYRIPTTHIIYSMLAQLARRNAQPIMGRRLQSTFASPRPSSLKGVLFGFFAGVSITGFGCYYYLLDEYKTSSNAIISDILLLQKTIRNMETHIRTLEEACDKKCK